MSFYELLHIRVLTLSLLYRLSQGIRYAYVLSAYPDKLNKSLSETRLYPLKAHGSARKMNSGITESGANYINGSLVCQSLNLLKMVVATIM